VSLPDKLLESVDETLDDARLAGVYDLNTTRSEIVRDGLRDWRDETRKEIEES